MFAKIEDAIKDIKEGKPVIVVDDGNVENEGAFVMAAELVKKESINYMIKNGGGLIYLALLPERLEELDFTEIVEENSNKNYNDFSISLDYEENKNGISAEERTLTIQKLLEKEQTRKNFKVPGHMFLVKAVNGGVLKRASNVDAAVDLAALAGLNSSGVICEILNESGSMAKLPELTELAKMNNVKIISIEELIAYRRARECYVTREAEANLPTAYGKFKMIGYVNRLNGEHHVALVKGEINPNDEVLVRVHSECLTGDVFHSLRCDCGEQLASALSAIEKEGKGILLYLRQEGRGIGLINKIKAYKLQEQGLDTEEANIALGFPSDMRDYGIGAQILSDLNVRKMRLMTNNPKKLVGLKGHGIEVVERVPLIMKTNPYDEKYFKTKKEKMGHLY
ncbi:MAG: bifunctional 3,4-dihydroxy-2-butanone-4-phosphate synthase/GTP cyclohydrolase [Clostridiaceae bacterium]|jgi:3,4-dihydroxy 2-butanone 4-phosphate synthase/GTP cyclohydrolase II|nr:bifunctional 3,4-dihydroxy-2-butanone-4-phosphate synthase/GTP cyclohydrolase [Clostridiaceae bacterium]